MAVSFFLGGVSAPRWLLDCVCSFGTFFWLTYGLALHLIVSLAHSAWGHTVPEILLLEIILFVWYYVKEVSSIGVNEVDDVLVSESDGIKEQQIFFVCCGLQNVEHGHELVKSNGVRSETLLEKDVLAQPHGEMV